MTFSSKWRWYSAAYEQAPLARSAVPQRIVGGAALGCVALACAWTLGVNLAGRAADPIEVAGTRGDKLAVRRPAPASNDYALLFDSHPILGVATKAFAPFAPAVQLATAPPAQPAAQTAQNIAQDIASPLPREVHVALSAASPATPPRVLAARRGASAPADKPTIFEKLFGGPSPLTLAYAAPDDRGILADRPSAAGRYDRSTAVYDISARTVYMPDGSRLEAHSGLGSLLDDPRHADARGRGVTPPTIYDLQLRESLFHGVRALRLIPQDDDKVFGRSGLLAHSFMLGPNGDSNGCVSFRNYEAFLRAYINGEIKRLAVVSQLD